MWKELTTSKQDKIKSEFQSRLKKDTGLLKLHPKNTRGGKIVNEQRLKEILPLLEKYYELWLAYPDKLIHMLLPPDTHFKLFPFQTLSIRANMRYKRVFQIATRGYSKSFMAVLTKMVKCVLLPGSRESMLAEHKNQAAQIGREKIQELVALMPLLEQEIDRRRGSETTFSKDYIRLKFRNKSELDIVGISDSTRGGRRHGMLFEEVKDLPQQGVNEVALPLLNIARRTRLGFLSPHEPHQQQLYVGSAGYKNTFAYDKCIEITIAAAIDPINNFSWGGDYRIPVFYGLLNKDFVDDLRLSSTYEESSFAREYMSKWTSTLEGSMFDFDKLSGLRKIKKPEWKAENDANVFYIASVDVARSSARSVIEVFKVRKGKDYFTKSIVNIILMEGRNFLYQACRIKELDLAFDFSWITVDTNGLGVGLVDFLMTENLDGLTGKLYPPYNVKNIKDYPDYQIDQKIGAKPKIWVLKTNQQNAGKIHGHCYAELFGGKVKLLIDEKEAKERLLQLQKGQKMSIEERIRYMEPYKNTTLLISETSNLKISQTASMSQSFKLEMIRTDAEKDTFSAMEYGLWTISFEEKDYYAKMRRGNLNVRDMMFFN